MPFTRWLRLSLVAICTVRARFRQARSIAARSGIARTKLPPSPMNAFTLPGQNALAGLDRVHALGARRIEAELLRDLVERHELGLLGDADRTLALDVGVAADGRDAGAVAADVALHAAACSRTWRCCRSRERAGSDPCRKYRSRARPRHKPRRRSRSQRVSSPTSRSISSHDVPRTFASNSRTRWYAAR